MYEELIIAMGLFTAFSCLIRLSYIDDEDEYDIELGRLNYDVKIE